MREPRFHKGDQVRFQFGIYPAQGVVKEDRGAIGINGRRLYLVEFRLSPQSESPREIELPAVELQLAQDAVSTE